MIHLQKRKIKKKYLINSHSHFISVAIIDEPVFVKKKAPPDLNKAIVNVHIVVSLAIRPR